MKWRACERFGINPPGFPDGWDDLNVWNQAKLLAYCQNIDHDENPSMSRVK